MKIWFDMDGTIANLYGVNNWLEMLRNNDPTPYIVAKPLVNLSRLARVLNRLQNIGYEIGIISWLSKSSTEEYDELVKKAKEFWLKLHMPSVHWNTVHIVEYGINKFNVCGEGILFDDEENNRNSWEDSAYEPNEIFDVLNSLLKAG